MNYKGKNAQVVTVRDIDTESVYKKLEDVANGREIYDVRLHQVDSSVWELTAIIEEVMQRQLLVEG